MKALIALQCDLCVLKWISFVLKTLFGYSLHSGSVKEKKRSEEDYNVCVHRSNILYGAKRTDAGIAGYNAFLLSHDRYESPVCLRDDSVSLFEFTETHAMFIVTEPGLDVYNSELSPFVYNTQFIYGKQLLTISMKHFMRFAAELRDPKSHVILLSNIGRCGSTLLTQMMEAVPNTVTMSEPEVLSLVMPSMFRRAPKFCQDNQAKLVGMALKVQCKEIQSRKVDYIIIKPRSFFICQTDLVAKECPYIRHVFLHRAPRKNISSFMAMVASFSYLFHKFVFSMWIEVMFDTLKDSSEYYPMAQDMKCSLQKNPDSLKVFAAYYAMHISSFLECRSKHGVDFHVVSYEELVLNPRQEMKKLLDHCKMPLDNIQGSIEAMEKDSQRNSIFSKDNHKSSRPKEFNDAQVQTINHILGQFGLPELDKYREAFK